MKRPSPLLAALPVLLFAAACGAPSTAAVDPTPEGTTDLGARRTTTDPQGKPRRTVPIVEPIWETDLDFALKRAQAEHRPVLIDFSASWCAACHQLKKVTFVDDLFKAQAGRFILVNVDVTNDEDPKVLAVEKKWKVSGLPLLVLLDTNGGEVARIADFIEAGDLAPKLAAIP